jgi:SapC
MQINPPFGYQAITPLRPDLLVKPWTGLRLPDAFCSTNALPVSVGETIGASRHYPLVFSNEGAIVAVLGLFDSDNLFVADRRWVPDVYVPVLARRYPFCTSTVRIDGVPQETPLLCVESGMITTKAGGEKLLDEARQPLEGFKNMFDMLYAHDRDLRLTARLIDMLSSHGLLESFDLRATLADGTSYSLSGMVRVSEDRMRNLTAKTLRSFIENGAMRLIYIHLNSLGNFDLLIERHTRLRGPLKPATAAPGEQVNA